MRILYVEDDPIDVKLASQALERHQPTWRLDVVATLAQARSRLRVPPFPDVVLCDLRLPDGNGLELLIHIRGRRLPVAVVILTGGGDHDTAAAALRAGADGYMIKHTGRFDALPKALAQALAHFQTSMGKVSQPIRILYAERKRSDQNLTLHHLTQHAPHVHLDVVEDIAEMLARLPRKAGEAADYDGVLLDYRAHGDDVLEAVKAMREDRGLDLPVVLITGQGSEELAARALHAGVDDYLTKHPGYLQELPAILENVCYKARLIREHASLLESEARVRLLLESTAEAIYGLDLDGRCTFANRACLHVLGYERAEELVGQHIHELTHHSHPDGTPYPAEECRICRAFRHNEAVHREDEVFWHRDGQPLPVEYWSHPMYRDGQVVGAVVTFFDVTARKEAERALKESEARYRSLFENMLHGYAYCRLVYEEGRASDYVYVEVNRAFETLTGFRHVVGKRVSEVVPGIRESNPELLGIYARVSETGRPERFETHVAALDKWFSVSAYSPARGYFITVFDNVTERKKAEEALRESEAQYRALFHGNSDAIFLHAIGPSGESGHFLKVNEAACRRLGYSQSELLTMSPLDIDAAGMDEKRAAAIEAILGRGQAIFEMQHQAKDGRVIPVEISATLIELHGRPMVLSMARDITERKQAQQELLRSRAKLRELTAYTEKTREDERARIARELHDELGQYLTALRMDANLIQMQYAEEHADLNTRLDGMKELIDHVIAEARRMIARLRPMVLDLGIVSAAQWLADDFRARSGVDCHLEMPNPELELDNELATTVFRILQESLTNVARHAQAKRVDVLIEETDGTLLLTVRDDGRGFDPAQVRLKKTFGLMGIRERVLMYGGSTKFDSRPGNGTTLTVSLPLKAGETP